MRYPLWNKQPLRTTKGSLLVKKFLWWPMKLYNWPYSDKPQWRWLETAYIVYMKTPREFTQYPDELKPAYWIEPELYDDSGLPPTKGVRHKNMFYA